jgi:hypothetical protein
MIDLLFVEVQIKYKNLGKGSLEQHLGHSFLSCLITISSDASKEEGSGMSEVPEISLSDKLLIRIIPVPSLLS